MGIYIVLDGEVKNLLDMGDERKEIDDMVEFAFMLREIFDLNDEDLVPKRKAMLSQPMAGKTEEEITLTRDRAVETLTARGFDVINTRFNDEWYALENMKERGVENIPLCFLAKSLENMSKCHAAYFCKGWKNARGCRIEHEAAKAYGLEIIYES